MLLSELSLSGIPIVIMIRKNTVHGGYKLLSVHSGQCAKRKDNLI